MTTGTRTTKPRRGAVAVGVLLFAAGCGGPPVSIEADDLPGDPAVEELRGSQSVVNCNPIPEAENRALGMDDRTWSFDMGDGVSVYSSVAVFYGSDLAEIDAAIDECVARSDPRTAVTERLSGLPDGVIGYRAVSGRSVEDRYGERLWTIADNRLVSVSVDRPVSVDTVTVDLPELLDKAVARSADFDPDA